MIRSRVHDRVPRFAIEAAPELLPQNGPAFTALTGRTLSGLYPDWSVASGNVLDVIGSSHLVPAGGPTFNWPTFHRRGVYCTNGARHEVSALAPGTADWLAFAEVTCVADLGANHGKVIGYGNDAFAGVNIYHHGAGTEFIYCRFDDATLNATIFVSVPDLRGKGPLLASVLVKRATNQGILRVSRDGVLVGTATADITGHGSYSVASGKFGTGDLSFSNGGNAVSYAGCEVLAGAAGATVQADLHAALGYE